MRLQWNRRGCSQGRGAAVLAVAEDTQELRRRWVQLRRRGCGRPAPTGHNLAVSAGGSRGRHRGTQRRRTRRKGWQEVVAGGGSQRQSSLLAAPGRTSEGLSSWCTATGLQPGPREPARTTSVTRPEKRQGRGTDLLASVAVAGVLRVGGRVAVLCGWLLVRCGGGRGRGVAWRERR